MLTIELCCLSGQYHATPWDHQVNEGGVEWPPSPWRLLRALIATWHLKARDEIEEATVSSIVETLAGSLPQYRLPQGVLAHTRHYMPLFDVDKGKTTKIFQAFIRLAPDDPVVVCWPDVDLTDEQRSALSLLLERLSYLGRAESWAEGRLGSAAPDSVDAAPVGLNPGTDDIVKLLAPLEPRNFEAWRDELVESMMTRELAAQQEKDRSKGKKLTASLSKKAVAKIEEAVPTDVTASLCCDTSDLKKSGWSQPPGSRWVEYTRPSVPTSIAQSGVPVTSENAPTVARFAVASQVPPRLTEALFQAEKIHTSLVKRSDGHPVFTGSDENHQPLTGHEHAYILPESHDTQGRITHITLYAPMGFDERARRALEGLRKVWGNSGHDLQLVLLGVGQPEDFAGLNTQAGACPLFVESRTWRSKTPFVSTRHVKRRKNGQAKLDELGLEIGGPEHDLRRLLSERGLRPEHVEELQTADLGKATRWLAFRTDRKRGEGRRGASHGRGFTLTFSEPVRGPLAFGYGAHLGLGQFEPA